MSINNNINPIQAPLAPQAPNGQAGNAAPRPTLGAVTALAQQLRLQANAYLPLIYTLPFGPFFKPAAAAASNQALQTLRQTFLEPGENLTDFDHKLQRCAGEIRQLTREIVATALSLDNSNFSGYYAAHDLLGHEEDGLSIQTPTGPFLVNKTYADRVMLYQVTGDLHVLGLQQPPSNRPHVA